MVNVTLNQPANDKLAAILGAYFDKRCTEPALQAQFLKQLAVTCHFRWAACSGLPLWCCVMCWKHAAVNVYAGAAPAADVVP
jgi:hypothetical protein